MKKEKLLTAPVSQPKALKGQKLGYMTFVLHLAPHELAIKGKNVCPNASPACIASCLNTAGRGGIFCKGQKSNAIQDARIRKTKLFFNDRKLFMSLLLSEIKKGIKYAEKKNFIPCFRLNGTSDLAWENFGVMQLFPNVQFYDYTKSYERMMNNTTKNYYFTFSRSECNWNECKQVLNAGKNVTVVFRKDLPKTYMGYKVVTGDDTDVRFLDEQGVIVGLKAKGKAKKDRSGFVVDVQN